MKRLEIEQRLSKNENDKFELPRELSIIKEVTNDNYYKMLI